MHSQLGHAEIVARAFREEDDPNSKNENPQERDAMGIRQDAVLFAFRCQN